jgi:hypothetical protein
VSGAPEGTTETWLGAGVGAVVGRAPVPREGSALGLSVGAALDARVGAAEGVAVAPSANAGTALASTAVHASAMPLGTVRRIESLSFVGPPGGREAG